MSYTLRISRPREVARQKKRPSINVLSIRNRTTYLDESAVVAFSGPLLILIRISSGMPYFMRIEEMKKDKVRKFFIPSSLLHR